MLWRWHDLPRISCYYFCLEPAVRKDTLVRTTSVTVMIFFFESGIEKVTWSQLCLDFLLNKYEAHWQQHFEGTLQFFILRTWINIRAKSFIKTSINVTGTRIYEDVWKKIVAQSVHLEEHCTKKETTFHLFYALLFLANLFLKFKFVISPSKKFFFIRFINGPSKMMKNAFYFIFKALFGLKIFKFLSGLFGHVEKTAWLERLG